MAKESSDLLSWGDLKKEYGLCKAQDCIWHIDWPRRVKGARMRRDWCEGVMARVAERRLMNNAIRRLGGSMASLENERLA